MNMHNTDNLPDSIVCGPNQTIPIILNNDNMEQLGYLDTKEWNITIKNDQPKTGKHLILLHEIIHLAAEHLKQVGLIKRQPDEKFVTYLAGTIFPMLALSGLWNGVSTEEVNELLKVNN